MPTNERPKTGKLNGRLWGARANDWAELQEPMTRPIYDAVFERIDLGTQTNYLNIGCGSGLAAQLATERGAKVSGIDAAENLLAIARSRIPGGQFRVADLEELPFADNTVRCELGCSACTGEACGKVGGCRRDRDLGQTGGHAVRDIYERAEIPPAASALGNTWSICTF